uniref:DUF2384 domain-containing protein n=1 Tax=Steinernema glaseri TaxID=37863 RepID=A0A1I7ZFR5_9BILA
MDDSMSRASIETYLCGSRDRLRRWFAVANEGTCESRRPSAEGWTKSDAKLISLGNSLPMVRDEWDEEPLKGASDDPTPQRALH